MSGATTTLSDALSAGLEVERIASGCVFTEGPVWIADEGHLLFSDIPANRLMRWDPENGIVVLREPNDKGNGMTIDNEGRLVVCEHLTSVVARVTSGTDREPIASEYDRRALNSPNDVIVAGNGDVLFSDPSFGRISPDFGRVRELEQPHNGVYRLPAGGGPVELLISDQVQPNGLCLSVDESILYVGDTGRAEIRAYDYAPGRAPLGSGRVFAEGISATEARDDGLVDGLKLDEAGNVYVTGPGGIWVYDAEGERLGMIEVPEVCANLNWGGEGWRTLFITATTSVYRVELPIGGNRLGYMR